MENTAAVKKKEKKKTNAAVCWYWIHHPASTALWSPLRATGQKKKNIYNSFEWNLICSPQLQHESCKRPEIFSKHFSLTETRLSMLQIINNLQLFLTTNCQHPVLKWFHMSFLFKAPKYSRYSCNNYVTDPQIYLCVCVCAQCWLFIIMAEICAK